MKKDIFQDLEEVKAKKKGWSRDFEVKDYKAIKEAEYDKLADLVRNNIDMEKVYKIIFDRDI